MVSVGVAVLTSVAASGALPPPFGVLVSPAPLLLLKTKVDVNVLCLKEHDLFEEYM